MDEQVKKRPEILDALAFAALDGKALIGRLARLFIVAEPTIKKAKSRRYRDDYVVNDKVIAAWMRPVYTPGRGKTVEMVSLVLEEVKRQQALRAKRAESVAYLASYGKTPKKDIRRNRVAAGLYVLMSKEYNESEETVKTPSCIMLTTHGEHLVAVDSGTYNRGSYFYARNRRTGRAIIAPIGRGKHLGDNLVNVFFSLAPKATRAALFAGVPVTVDLDTLAFVIDGKQGDPWKLEGDAVITTDGKAPVVKLN
jgi:hypothetical protein